MLELNMQLILPHPFSRDQGEGLLRDVPEDLLDGCSNFDSLKKSLKR